LQGVHRLPESVVAEEAAIATSFVGPFFTDRALMAAPVPRPPQPTRASGMVLFSAA
jgi:hypothetical protein